MPSYTYPLERGGPKLIEVTWKGFYKNVRVLYEEKELGTIAHRAELKEGKCFALPAGEELCVKLVNTFMASELHVLVDGKPLPGSGSDPWQQLKICSGSLYFFAAISFLFGTLIVMADAQINLGGYIAMGVGILYAALAWFVSRASMAALIISITLVAVNAILLIAMPFLSGQPPRIGWFIFYLFMILPLTRGFSAIRRIEAEEKEKPFDQL